jgi:hypothetical protein
MTMYVYCVCCTNVIVVDYYTEEAELRSRGWTHRDYTPEQDGGWLCPQCSKHA